MQQQQQQQQLCRIGPPLMCRQLAKSCTVRAMSSASCLSLSLQPLQQQLHGLVSLQHLATVRESLVAASALRQQGGSKRPTHTTSLAEPSVPHPKAAAAAKHRQLHRD